LCGLLQSARFDIDDPKNGLLDIVCCFVGLSTGAMILVLEVGSIEPSGGSSSA